MEVPHKYKYNSFKGISRVPYIIVTEYLFYNEDIWKLLYYVTDENGDPIARPLERPNLTSKQKRALIYDGKNDINDFRVFFSNTPLSEETTGQVQQIRIFRDRILPKDVFMSNATWTIELPCHNAISTIIVDDIIVNRTDLLQEEIFETLNGREISGIGTLMFSYDSPQRMSDRSDFTRFNTQFSGYIFNMSCNWTGNRKGVC